MPDKELSHQDSALLFIKNLQNELAKTNSSAQGQGSQAKPQKMPPPPQSRRSQNQQGESQSEHRLQLGCTVLTLEQVLRSPTGDDTEEFMTSRHGMNLTLFPKNYEQPVFRMTHLFSR